MKNQKSHELRSKCVLNKNDKNTNPDLRSQTQKLKKKKKIKNNSNLRTTRTHFSANNLYLNHQNAYKNIVNIFKNKTEHFTKEKKFKIKNRNRSQI